MNRGKYVSLILCWSLFLPAFAQTEEIQTPPPQAPFIRVPERAAWDVAITFAHEPGATKTPAGAQPGGGSDTGTTKEESHMTHIQSAKVDNLKRDLLIYSDGHQNEVWYYGKYAIVTTRDPNNPQPIETNTSDIQGVNRSLFVSSTFPGIDWIQAGDYKNVQKQGSGPCYYFERNASPGQGKAEAWIDVASRLPAKVQIGPVTFQFTYKEPPSTSLEMPAPYAKATDRLKAWEERRAALEKAGY